MGACQFPQCLIASRFIHVKRETAEERESLNSTKSVSNPKSNLHNKQRREERAKMKGLRRGC